MTLAEAYRRTTGVSEARVARRMFWSCLHRRAIPLVPVLSTLFPGYFLPEAQLLAQVGRARSLAAVDEEIRVFRHQDENQGWLRRRARLRLSTRRLRRMAAAAFAQASEAGNSTLVSA